jgi:hypothetical protein
VGLNASVYCNCYKLSKVRTPPPQPDLTYTEETGQVWLKWDAPGADKCAFYAWLESACEHGPLGQLVRHRLGNIAGVARLRGLLGWTSEQFPVLLSKVLYDGTHCGDFLSRADIENVATEMELVHTMHCANSDEEGLLRTFETQMMELIQGARTTGNPIVF